MVNRYITALLVVLAATGMEAQTYQQALKFALTDISYDEFIHTQTVNYQCSQSLRINILSDNQQRTTTLSSRLENWQELLQARNLLIIKRIFIINCSLS